MWKIAPIKSAYVTWKETVEIHFWIQRPTIPTLCTKCKSQGPLYGIRTSTFEYLSSFSNDCGSSFNLYVRSKHSFVKYCVLLFDVISLFSLKIDVSQEHVLKLWARWWGADCRHWITAFCSHSTPKKGYLQLNFDIDISLVFTLSTWHTSN